MPLEAGQLPAWWPELVAWAAVAVLVATISVALAAWMIHARVKAFERRLASLERLEELKAALDRIVASHADLDLRRLEHVLIDVRDGQRRLEDRLLAVVEAGRAERAPLEGARALVASGGPGSPGAASALADRVVTRLLALGYERVQLVTPLAELALLVGGDGEVRIEARRDGAPCKGRIVLREGTIADVQIQAAYSTFP